MKRLLPLLFLLITPGATVAAIDLNGLEPIGSVASFTRADDALTITCNDASQVRLRFLAPDLIRVRVSFRKALPERDHSWAIDKTVWGKITWSIKEEQERLICLTDELEVVINRAPLLIEFRDAKTHEVINSDERPMLFDPRGTAVAAAKKLGFDEHFYGLGEKASRLDKRRGEFTMWNSDTPAYAEGTDPIYQSVPFYIGWQGGKCYGIFFDNSYRTNFDFGRSSQVYAAFSAAGGDMNYYFFYGPAMKKIISRYTELTGRMPMPPMWALGNQQSRWSYYPQSVVEAVVNEYRKRDLPLDVIHLDIDYMQGYRIFTWDTSRFPNPQAFTDKLRGQGVKIVTIVDPGVKYQPPQGNTNDATAHPELMPQDKSYYVFNQGMFKNYFLHRQNGQLYIGQVWPGKAVYVDYTLEAARKWWGELLRAYTDNGVAGIWTDMNEPSDFVDQSGKTQTDVVNYDEGENSLYAKNRNVFALLMTRATREGLERLQPNKRPFILTRAGYAGIQRYSTMWCGDNTSTWETMALSIPMYQTLGLSGETFVGGDIGGFIGRSDGEMLARWYQVGFLTPFCRNHKEMTGYDHEPWRFGKYYEEVIRKYLKLRYRLLPFLYTTLEEAHRTGLPLFRPLLLNYQTDANTLNIDDEFMIGTDLLVAPILKPNQTSRMVYLPEGAWFDFWTGKKIGGGTMLRVEAPLDTVPMFVRGGAILPMGPEMNWVGEKPFDPIELQIYADERGEAQTTLYEDDGMSNDYQRGVFRRTTVKVSKSADGLQIKLDAPEGIFNTGVRYLVFTVRTMNAAKEVRLDGKTLASTKSGEKANGWSQTAGGLSVTIADDGKAHQIAIR